MTNKNVTESTIEKFCEDMNIGPAAIANACSVERQYINNFKHKFKQPHIVRYNEKTGDIWVVKTEKIMCSGNLTRKRADK